MQASGFCQAFYPQVDQGQGWVRERFQRHAPKNPNACALLQVWKPATGCLLHNLTASDDGCVHSVVVSAHGTAIVAAYAQGVLRVWHRLTGDLLQTLRGHTAGVHSVAMLADGHTVVSGSADCAVAVWDLRPGGLLHTNPGHADAVTSVALSADGGTVVSADQQERVCVWNRRTRELSKVRCGHRTAAVSADGSVVVWACEGNKVGLWNQATGDVQLLQRHTREITSVAVSADGRTVVSGSMDWRVQRYALNPATGAWTAIAMDHSDYVTSVAISADGKVIVSVAGTVLRVWDASGHLLRTLHGHTERLSLVKHHECQVRLPIPYPGGLAEGVPAMCRSQRVTSNGHAAMCRPEVVAEKTRPIMDKRFPPRDCGTSIMRHSLLMCASGLNCRTLPHMCPVTCMELLLTAVRPFPIPVPLRGRCREGGARGGAGCAPLMVLSRRGHGRWCACGGVRRSQCGWVSEAWAAGPKRQAAMY